MAAEPEARASSVLVIPLAPALPWEGGTIAELRLREPAGAEMMAAEACLDTGFSAETVSAFRAKLVSAVSGVAEEALNLLPCSVMRRAQEFVGGFDTQAVPALADPLAPSLDLEIGHAVSYGAASATMLLLREPNVGQRRRAETALRTGTSPAASRRYQLILVAEVSGVPFAAVGGVPVSVLNRAEAYLRGFIEPGPATGTA